MPCRSLAFVLLALGCAARAEGRASPPAAPSGVASAQRAQEPRVEVVPPPAPESSARPVAEPIRGRVLRAGRTLPQPGVDVERAAPGTASGVIHVTPATSNPEFFPEGTLIRACLGVSFGIGVLISGAPHGKVIQARVRVTHPPIGDQRSGRLSTVDEWDAPMNAGIERYTGWRFEDPTELAWGVWRFEVMVSDQVIAAHEFSVSPPHSADCDCGLRIRPQSITLPD